MASLRCVRVVSSRSARIMPESKNKQLPFHVQLAMSGTCGSIAWLFCHPFELAKNKAIISAALDGSKKPLGVAFREISKQPGGLYRGIESGIARQVSYTSFRIGLYEPIRGALVGDRETNVLDRIIAGATAGSIASFLSSPVEVALVQQSKAVERMSLPSAMGLIWQKSGLTGFWRGCVPLMSRAAIVGISQVAFYDQCATWVKSMWPDMQYLLRCLIASTITGIFYAAVTMPVEVSRILLSSQQGGEKKYKNMPQAIFSVAKERGVGSLYIAYLPYMMRCTVHSIVAFLLIEAAKERLNKIYS